MQLPLPPLVSDSFSFQLLTLPRSVHRPAPPSHGKLAPPEHSSAKAAHRRADRRGLAVSGRAGGPPTAPVHSEVTALRGMQLPLVSDSFSFQLLTLPRSVHRPAPPSHGKLAPPERSRAKAAHRQAHRRGLAVSTPVWQPQQQRKLLW